MPINTGYFFNSSKIPTITTACRSYCTHRVIASGLIIHPSEISLPGKPVRIANGQRAIITPARSTLTRIPLVPVHGRNFIIQLPYFGHARKRCISSPLHCHPGPARRLTRLLRIASKPAILPYRKSFRCVLRPLPGTASDRKNDRKKSFPMCGSRKRK